MVNTINLISDKYPVAVVGPKGCGNHLNKSVTVLETRSSNVVLFLAEAFLRGVFLSWKIKPKILFSGSGVTAPICFVIGTLQKIKTVTYLHGLDIIARDFGYQQLFLPFIRRQNLLITNSQNTERLARKHGVLAKTVIINPGVDMPNPTFLDQHHKNKDSQESNKQILFVGRLVRRKGLREFISNCMPGLISKFPDLQLKIIGEEPKVALKQEHSIKADLLATISELKLNRAVQFMGNVDDHQLQKSYAIADCLIFPLLETKNDVEGFGMVAAEAAAYGLRTVAFDIGGVSDAVIGGKTGTLVAPGNYQDFSDALAKELGSTTDWPRREQCAITAARFSWENYQSRMNNTLELLLID